MPVPVTTPKLPRVLARNEVYAQIRMWIVEGILEPEEILKDHQLAEILGVSRTPVREALRRLEDEGLVTTAANRWTRVAPLDIESARQLYEVVAALERLSTELSAPRLTIGDIAQMESATQELARALAQRDVHAAVAADERFHNVYLARADNAELAELLRHAKTKLRRLEIAYFNLAAKCQASVQEHQQIVRHLQDGHYEAAVAAVVANWRNSWVRFERGISHAEP